MQTAVGRVEDYDKLYLVVSDTRLASLDQHPAQTVLRSGADGSWILLEDVATVRMGTAPNVSASPPTDKCRALQIYQQPGGNSVQIAQEVKRASWPTQPAACRRAVQPCELV